MLVFILAEWVTYTHSHVRKTEVTSNEKYAIYIQ